MKAIRYEPAMTAGVIAAALALLVSYGLLDTKKAALWGTLLTGILPLVQAWVTRRYVMPVSKIVDAGLNTETITHRAEVANGAQP